MKDIDATKAAVSHSNGDGLKMTVNVENNDRKRSDGSMNATHI